MLKTIEILEYDITMLFKWSSENDLIKWQTNTHFRFVKQKHLQEKRINQESPRKIIGEYFNRILTGREKGIRCIKILV